MIRWNLRYFGILVAALGLCASGAQAATFAQFYMLPAQNEFFFTSVGPNSATLTATNVSIKFQYSNITDLPPEFQGDIDARITIDMETNSNAMQFGSLDIQPFTGFVNSVSIDLDTPVWGFTNLLTATMSGGFLTGSEGGGSASFSASDAAVGESVEFTSDFLTFLGTTDHALGLSFSSVHPGLLFVDAGHPLASFDAAATGTFSTTNDPRFYIPEPHTAALLGVGLIVIGLLRRRGTSGDPQSRQ
jgi:hypothetical protein